MTDHGFPKHVRLLKSSDFERVFAARNSVGNSSFALFGSPNELKLPRLGITASRRIGNAVARNRWKRLVREAFRLSQHELPAVDLVCVVRGPEPPELKQFVAMLAGMAWRIDRRARKPTQKSSGDL